MNSEPIFIHSLFRAGSTYLFSEFRANSTLNCYYEPMHELVAWASEDVDRLALEQRSEKMRRLHHPSLDKPYFEELRKTWPCWKGTLKPSTVYGGYFSRDPDVAGVLFYQKLIEVSPDRPLFSDCRTGGRLATLKDSLGGMHGFLWRNPWDQWWSYQIDTYFEAVNRIITQADPLGEPLRLLVKERSLALSLEEGFSEARDFYALRPLCFEDSYALFYSLWLITLDIAFDSADLLINIDSLSHTVSHRKEILSILADWGVAGIDFSKAKSPVAVYTPDEHTAFHSVENSVHATFLRAGWEDARLTSLRALREQHLPAIAEDPGLHRQAAKHRELLLSKRAEHVERSAIWERIYAEKTASLQEAHIEVGAISRFLEHQTKVFEFNRERLERFASMEAELKDFKVRIEQLMATHSWRVTAPLRVIAKPIILAAEAWRTGRLGLKAIIQQLAVRVVRSPKLYSAILRLLIWMPPLMRWLVKTLDLPNFPSAAVPPVSPEKLSPRAKTLYNRLARELRMPEVSVSVSEPPPEGS